MCVVFYVGELYLLSDQYLNRVWNVVNFREAQKRYLED
jgi:superoxide dismutase